MLALMFFALLLEQARNLSGNFELGDKITTRNITDRVAFHQIMKHIEEITLN